jgi:NADPH-dependent ferric siderophore reductase
VSSTPDTRRVRHETRRRNLTVSRIEKLAPKMVRVVLQGEELSGFTSLGFDDHLKLFFTAEDGRTDSPPSTAHGPSGGDNASPAAMRDFTPRWFDAAAGELWIDFFLHEAGPAAAWATRVAVGQTLTVGGPRGSFVISLEGIDSHVLDATAPRLPSRCRGSAVTLPLP